MMLYVEKEVAEMAKLSLAAEAAAGAAAGYSNSDKGLVKAAEVLDKVCPYTRASVDYIDIPIILS